MNEHPTKPEAPCVGAIYRARRSRSGRLWEIGWKDSWGLGAEVDTWRLFPLPDEHGRALMAGLDEDGLTHGGLVPLNRTTEQLERWELVGFSEKAGRVFAERVGSEDVE